MATASPERKLGGREPDGRTPDARESPAPMTPGEPRLAALIANLRKGIVVEDPAGRITQVNAAFCQMWGLTAAPEALIGRLTADVGRPPDGLLVDPAGARASWSRLSSSQGAVFDMELRTTDGRMVLCDYVPFEIDGAPAGGVWIYRDATQHHDASIEIRRLNQELEQRVAARTEELARTNFDLENSLRRLGQTQEQLIHAGKMAAVGTLIAGLSHELNNPLGIIVGYVQGLLRRTPPDATTRASLEAIERQSQRCAHLVRSLLDFSRNRPATREDVMLEPLIERAFELTQGDARRRSVELRWRPRPPLPVIKACAQEIESTLLNLLSNAIDATPATGSVTVAASAATRDGLAGLEVDVIDTGTGIPRGVLPRIFDPFFTTKPVGEGTGIGLALTRQVIDGHGGRIEVRTAEGVGTTMRLWLPCSPAPERSRAGTPPAPAPHALAASGAVGTVRELSDRTDRAGDHVAGLAQKGLP